jgi:hypothetical protein
MTGKVPDTASSKLKSGSKKEDSKHDSRSKREGSMPVSSRQELGTKHTSSPIVNATGTGYKTVAERAVADRFSSKKDSKQGSKNDRLKHGSKQHSNKESGNGGDSKHSPKHGSGHGTNKDASKQSSKKSSKQKALDVGEDPWATWNAEVPNEGIW